MNVLVIPEDFRKDQYLLSPLIKAMFQHLGRPKARIDILRDPLLGGVEELLKWENLQEIIEDNGMVDLFLLCLDRDCNDGRKNPGGRGENRPLRVQAIEHQAVQLFPTKKLMGESAIEELEVWILAGLDLPKEWVWKEVRQDCHPKENYFAKLAQARHLTLGEGEGRKTLGEEAAKRYAAIRQKCPELEALEKRIAQWMAPQG
ncbi:MAG: hypothetical protein HQL51_13945 [Magnetococcales bacterium]|nr:hypothetical protein [Magnetococcales bacterium]